MKEMNNCGQVIPYQAIYVGETLNNKVIHFGFVYLLNN